MIDGFYTNENKNKGEIATPWTVHCINCLHKYVALNHIGQLLGFYITLKMDPSVFVEPESL